MTERFLDWYPFKTKLYIRGKRGKPYDVMNALRADLTRQLQEFFLPFELRERRMRNLLIEWRDADADKDWGDFELRVEKALR